MVAREIPVARSTSPMPPCPSARASVAAHSRRDRSVNTGANAACFARSVANRTRHGTMRPANCTSRINQLFIYKPLVRRGDVSVSRADAMIGAGHLHADAVIFAVGAFRRGVAENVLAVELLGDPRGGL